MYVRMYIRNNDNTNVHVLSNSLQVIVITRVVYMSGLPDMGFQYPRATHPKG